MFDRGLTAAAIFAGFVVRGVGFDASGLWWQTDGCLPLNRYRDVRGLRARILRVDVLLRPVRRIRVWKERLDLRPFNATLSYVHGRGVWGSVLRVTRETGVMGSVPSAPSG